jgi:hypothetical protein
VFGGVTGGIAGGIGYSLGVLSMNLANNTYLMVLAESAGSTGANLGVQAVMGGEIDWNRVALQGAASAVMAFYRAAQIDAEAEVRGTGAGKDAGRASELLDKLRDGRVRFLSKEFLGKFADKINAITQPVGFSADEILVEFVEFESSTPGEVQLGTITSRGTIVQVTTELADVVPAELDALDHVVLHETAHLVQRELLGWETLIDRIRSEGKFLGTLRSENPHYSPLPGIVPRASELSLGEMDVIRGYPIESIADAWAYRAMRSP